MNIDKVVGQLKKPADKREIGGHGDLQAFMVLVSMVPEDKIDLLSVDLPMKKVCSTCRFLVPEFHEKMPCWSCMEDESLPKWRAKTG